MERKKYVLCALAAVLVFWFAGGLNACIIPAGGSLSDYETYANDPMFDAEGRLDGVQSDGTVYPGGCFVMFSPQWALTAGHVIYYTNGQPNFSSMRGCFTKSGETVGIDACYVYPGYLPTTPYGQGSDIALIHFSTPVTDVTPAVLYSGTYQAGMTMNICGYGAPGIYPNDPGNYDGVKRAGQNVVNMMGWPLAGVESQYMLCDFGPAFGRPTLPLEFQGSQGDSGGGWFLDVGGTMQLAGLTNFGIGPYHWTGGIEVGSYNDWIGQTTNAPEPSTIVLFFAMLPFLVFAWRKWHRRTV